MKPSPSLNCSPRAWTTSCYGDTAETSPMELDALRQHVAQCSHPSPRLGAVVSGVQSMQCFVSGRLMTTLAVVAALTGICLWLF